MDVLSFSKRTHPGSYVEQDFRRVIKADVANMLVTGTNLHNSE